ncbi:MAG TPA: YihY/virulence factor BrkB family protein [Candidatus Acidoferrales bacterium]
MAATLFMLHGASVKDISKRTWEEVNHGDVFGRAAQLAYFFFLALFPFLICVISALSVFGFADRGRALIFHFLSETAPPSAFGLIDDTIEGIIRAGGPLKMSIGIIAALWAASAGMNAVIDTMNAVYRVKDKRSLAKRYGIAVGLTIVIGVLLMVSIGIVLFGNTIVHVLGRGEFFAEVWSIVQWVVVLAFTLLAFSVIYYLAPDLVNREWHWITPGAVFAVAIWVLISLGLRVYLHFFNGYSGTYGTLTGVIILLLWFYMSGIAILSGGALNGVLDRAPG